jgi:hypothetical protein
MSLRTSLLRTANIIRALASPTTLGGGQGLDVWINTLSIITRTWPGKPGEGTPTDSVLTLTPNPELREVSAREVASSGGRYKDGDIVAENITPAHVGGGYTPEQLKPTVAAPTGQIIYRITGPLAGDYRLANLNVEDPFEYVLTLTRTNTTP